MRTFADRNLRRLFRTWSPAALLVAAALALALLVHPTAARSAALRVTWGPILSDETPTSIRIGWATNDDDARCVVVCGGHTYTAQDNEEYHEAHVIGLTPGRSYQYQVVAREGGDEARSATYEFRTPPRNLTRWSFCAFGDNRSQRGPHRSVVDGVLRVQPRPWFVVNTGDLVENGRESDDWDTFFDIERPLVGTVAYYPCLGNHERHGKYYFDTFPLPHDGGPRHKAWYSFRFANAFFVSLDTDSPMETQAKYLDAELTKGKKAGARWLFVFFHVPPYSCGPHGSNTQVQKYWVPIITKHKVTAVFNGHDHLYDHSIAHGINYFVLGGGGAPLYRVNSTHNPYSVKAVSAYHFAQVLVDQNAVRVRVLRPDGRLIDSVVIK